MAEYMAKERAETIERQKAYLGWRKEKEAETDSRLKDFQATNRAFEEKLGKELE